MENTNREVDRSVTNNHEKSNPNRNTTPSFLNRRWTLIDPPPDDILNSLDDQLQIGRTLIKILINRGIDTLEKAREFFKPGIDYLHNPFLMNGMEVAIERILRARDAGEKIMVFGDYDVDGTNGTAMLFTFLEQIGCKVMYYIPDRLKEGYGLSIIGIDRAIERGVTLLVSIDCGMTANEQVIYANDKGIDVIVCDHHEPSEELPPAVAILNPLKPGCQYPYKHLCGGGVGFKLIQGLAQTLGIEEQVFEYLDFVALASAADIVPLDGENRIMVKLGLDLINTRPRTGIQAIINSAGLKLGKIGTGQIVFVIAPRINAVGRLGDARRAVDLLTCLDPQQAKEFAQVVETENYNRRKIDEETFNQAREIAESYIEDGDDFLPLILHQNDWHPGVIGIVASRLVEKFYRPTILMTTVDGVAKGSARSIAGFDIYSALKKVQEHILQFGGHKYAAGLSVDIEHLDEFRKAFNEVAKDFLNEETLTPEIRIDAILTFDEITQKFIRILEQFAPFGPVNLNPVFYSNSVDVVGTPRIVGKNHLLMKLRQNGTVMDAIAFNMGDRMSFVNQKNKLFQIVYTIHKNEWNGITNPQLRIKDMREQN